MTKDEAIRLAEQAGMRTITYEHDDPTYFTDQLDIEKFAALIRQYENEACAKVCDIEASVQLANVNEAYQHGKEMGATVCAEAIRQREKE